MLLHFEMHTMTQTTVERHSSSCSSREQDLLRSLSAISRSLKHRRSERDRGSDGAGRRPRSTGRRGDAGVSPSPSRDADYEARGAARRLRQGFRGDYVLGERVRAPADAIVEPTEVRAIRAARALRAGDFAFVRRSDASFTYAILAYRCHKTFENVEECMVFVVDLKGSTKVVRERQGACVRLVAADACHPERKAKGMNFCANYTRHSASSPAEHPEEHRACLRQEISSPAPCKERGKVDWTPPRAVSFVTQMDDDECSMLSSVSERARGRRGSRAAAA